MLVLYDIIKRWAVMLYCLKRVIKFGFRTPEQEAFIRSLPRITMNNDEEVIDGIRKVYESRVTQF